MAKPGAPGNRRLHLGAFAGILMAMSEQNQLAERARKAGMIIANPTGFKVCEGCESIVAVRVVTCPNCHGYRFDDSPAAVVAQARLLGSRAQTSVVEEDLF